MAEDYVVEPPTAGGHRVRKVPAENVFKTMPKHRVIVSDEDFHGGGFLVPPAGALESGPSGMRTVTVVPLPLAL